MRVLKIGGNQLNDDDFLVGLAQATAVIAQQEPVVLVHGGGQAIADLSSQLGITSYKVDGLRVTDAALLQLVEMVLSGQSNKLLVRMLQRAGLDAIGISGVDGRLLTAEKQQHADADLGYVGRIVAVRRTLIDTLLAAGFTPVISPVSADTDQQHYNINADEAATAIAAALEADQFDFISNVPGVLHDGRVVPHMTPEQAEQMISEGVITDGMIPKVRAATSAIAHGVARTRIVDLDGLTTGGGTTFA